MSNILESSAPQASSPLGFFERYLSLRVFLCIIGGTLTGLYAPQAAQAVGELEIAQVNIPVGLLIWVMIIAMLAVPILLQTLFIAALGYWLCRQLKVRHDIAGPAAMIGASNFFELAVASALYGFNSGAALATVVGVLIEVPVMLWLVRMVNNSQGWYERQA